MATSDVGDLSEFRQAVLLRNRCRRAAVANGERLGIALSAVQANVAYDAMVDHIRADERARVLDEVQAALRDEAAFREWWFGSGHILIPTSHAFVLTGGADYLRDTVGGECSHADRFEITALKDGGKIHHYRCPVCRADWTEPAESHGEPSGGPGTPGSAHEAGSGEMAGTT